jgi:NTP pyrophosphatase (non-canonical NTP hydrolase)
MALAEEAGETAGTVAKALRKGEAIDRGAVAMELGDVLWQVAACAGELGYTLSEIAALNLQLASASDDERRKVAGLLKQRQEQLLPHYLKVAEQYADLHDVPARMLAKVLPACPPVICART